MSDSIYFADIQVRLPDLRVWRGDQEIHMSLRELRLLLILMSSPYQCFSADDLVKRMKLTGAPSLHQAVYSLRTKLENNYVINMKRGGYRFANTRRT